MALPLYVKTLIALLKEVGGWEQQQIAKHLGVTPGVVSTWATGQRPIPRRHFRPLLDLVFEALRRYAETHHDDLINRIHDWEFEMSSKTGVLAESIQQAFEALKSPYAKGDPLTLPLEERQELRYYAFRLVMFFDYLQDYQDPFMLANRRSRKGLPDDRSPEEVLRNVGRDYAREFFSGEEG